MTPIELYQKYFPHARPNIFQMEYIEAEISDLTAWKKALEFWALNDYRAQSVFKMIEYYKEQLKADPDGNCSHCENKRRIQVNDYVVPCVKCRPAEEKAFWRSRGKIAA